ncbi:MAG: hypothetical protein HZA90_18670 [Verrucomicrobia bacterium]|nr:hypothetical protein [Verrucomicrobiota bacterium]
MSTRSRKNAAGFVADAADAARVGKYFRLKQKMAVKLAEESERTGRNEIRILERALEMFFALKPSEREVWNQEHAGSASGTRSHEQDQ